MSYIYTYTRKVIPFEEGVEVDPDLIEIEDIAHALSQICRYTGHTRKFYSVAEHSIHISRIVYPVAPLWGLLHDAAEAYVGDMHRPLKIHLPFYRAWEKKIMKAVILKFNLCEPMPAIVKEADNAMLVNEMRDLMGRTKPGPEWIAKDAPYVDVYVPMTPEQAKDTFLRRFYLLIGGKDAK